MIKFPNNASVKINDQRINLNGFLLDTTAPVITPHAFNDGKDLGEDFNRKSMIVFLNNKARYLITKTDYLKDDKGEFILDANGKKQLDFKNQIKYHLKASEVKEAMDFWLDKKIKIKADYDKEQEDIDLNTLFDDIKDEQKDDEYEM